MRDLSRLDDLLADRALAALSPADEAELAESLAASDDAEGDAARSGELDQVLALAALSVFARSGDVEGRPPPRKLLGRLQVDAAAWARQQAPSSLPPASRGPVSLAAGPLSTRPLRTPAMASAEAAARARLRAGLLVVGAVLGWVLAAGMAIALAGRRPPDPPKNVTVSAFASAPVPPPFLLEKKI